MYLSNGEATQEAFGNHWPGRLRKGFDVESRVREEACDLFAIRCDRLTQTEGEEEEECSANNQNQIYFLAAWTSPSLVDQCTSAEGKISVISLAAWAMQEDKGEALKDLE